MAKNNRQLTDASASDLPPGIGRPAHRALAATGITQLKQLTKISETEVLKLHGVGPKAVRILKEAMSKRNLTFASIESSNNVSEQAKPRIVRRMPKRSR